MENQQEKEFTVEELAAQKENMLKFYTESLPYLDAQYQYEELLLKIDEARFKRNNIQMQYAMMAQAQQEAELKEGSDFDIDNEPSIPEQGKKKLRKV
jgi:threonyl-tRNA synthetase